VKGLLTYKINYFRTRLVKKYADMIGYLINMSLKKLLMKKLREY